MGISLMRIMLGQVLPGLAATALLLAGGYSQAQTIVYTYSRCSRKHWQNGAGTSSSRSSIPALGVLESVRITASYGITTSGSVSNMDQRSRVFQVQAGSRLSLDLPASLGVLEVTPFAQRVRFKLPGLSSAAYGSYSPNSSVQLTFSGADLAPFLGTGTLSFPGQTSPQDLLTGGGGQIAPFPHHHASATITVEYS